MAFEYLHCSRKEDYIEEFKLLYSETIFSPEGLIVSFNLKENNIRHFLCGDRKTEILKERAGKIKWIGALLRGEEVRLIKVNPKDNTDLYFLSIEKSYVVRCRIIESGYLSCYTAYPIYPRQKIKMLKWDNFY